MTRLIPFMALALVLSACATAPESVNKEALAREVIAISGQTEDVRQALRLVAPGMDTLLSADGVGESCRRDLGRDAPVFARAACEALEAAMGLAKAGAKDASGLLLDGVARMETKAALALADTYSVRELQAMRRYYASPEGRAIVEKRRDYWQNLARRMSER